MESQEILSAYSDYVVKKNVRPITMAAFAKKLKINEVDIYKYFANFESMESAIFKHFIDNAINLAHKNSEKTEGPDSRETLLTFYFSLTEILKMNRSLVLFLIPASQNSLSKLKTLKTGKASFSEFIQNLELDTPGLSFIPDNSIKNKAVGTVAWVQFCSILLYWIKDSSKNFEKTDVFVEKSLKFSFDIVESKVMESMVDLGKFIFGKS
jgi:hypothetical protein